MGDLMGVLYLIGQFVVPVAGLGVIVFLVRRLARYRSTNGRDPVPDARVAPDSATDGSSVPPSPAERRAASRTSILVAISGMSLPWIVGLAVKLRLDALGQPTYPVAGFLEPTAVFILLTATALQWCWPFLLLAFWIRSRHFPRLARGRGFPERLLLARTIHLFGMAGGAALFVPVFRSWDTMYIFVPLGFGLLPLMAAGWGAGLLILRIRKGAGLRTRR